MKSRICIIITFMFIASQVLAEIHGPFIQVGSNAAKESIVCWLATEDQTFSLKENGEWTAKKIKQQPFGSSKYTANRVVLTGLAAGSTYEFRIGTIV